MCEDDAVIPEGFSLRPYLKTWGLHFQKARKMRGVSQAAVGRLIGVPQSSISRFESGDECLGPQALLQYTRLLGLPAWLLFVESPESETTHFLFRMAALPPAVQRAIGGFLDAMERVEDTSSHYSLLGANY